MEDFKRISGFCDKPLYCPVKIIISFGNDNLTETLDLSKGNQPNNFPEHFDSSIFHPSQVHIGHRKVGELPTLLLVALMNTLFFIYTFYFISSLLKFIIT